MGQITKIEWCHHTFNPWMGCAKVSPGCDFCYACGLCKAYGHAEWGASESRNRTSPDYWKKPIKWNRDAEGALVRPRVLAASLADVFDNQAPQEWRVDLFGLIRQTPNLDWLLLTKRPQNIRKMLPKDWGGEGYANVWLGTSAENQTEYDRRWPVLSAIPARIRYISYEPALGPLVMSGTSYPDWLICGGESGMSKGIRVMDPQWARDIRDQCKREKVAFFFKQWGTARSNPIVFEQGLVLKKRTDTDAHGKWGGVLDGQIHHAFPA